MKTSILPLALVLLAACKGKPAERGLIDGYMPVYSSRTAALSISNSAPQPFVNGGKIATLGNILYQVEQDKGIHIINISNPSLPVKTGFINVALCRELTLKGNYLYTNNMNDLVVLDISNPANVAVSSRIANAFPDLGVQFPPEAEPGDYFECADAAKGVVVRWELTKINNPQCRK
jgi:LVIVD repeat